MSEENGSDKVTAAAAEALNKQGEAAQAVTETAQAETQRHTAEAAEAATAAATAATALANANAATTIKENEENLEWLRQHATNTDTSLKELRESHSQMVSSLPSMMEAQHQKLMERLSPLLTQRTPQEETIPEVNPENEKPEGPSAAEKKKSLKKRNWL